MTITISQTFYTDGTQKTTGLMQKSAAYFNSQSGKYGLQTKNGTYTINYSVTVKEGGDFNENYPMARKDDEANYVETNYYSPDALTIMGDYGAANEGGDFVEFSDNEEIVNAGVYQHEVMHTQGVSHEAIGETGTELNETAVGATLEYAGANSDNLKIKVKNASKSDQLKTKKPIDQPKVKYEGEDLKLKGSVIKL